MKFIVKANEENQSKSPHWPPMHTMCALCSEDPRFCYEW